MIEARRLPNDLHLVALPALKSVTTSTCSIPSAANRSIPSAAGPERPDHGDRRWRVADDLHPVAVSTRLVALPGTHGPAPERHRGECGVRRRLLRGRRAGALADGAAAVGGVPRAAAGAHRARCVLFHRPLSRLKEACRRSCSCGGHLRAAVGHLHSASVG